MMIQKENRQLIKVLRKAGTGELQWRMAAILWHVNGIDNAMEYVAGLVKKGLADFPSVVPAAPRVNSMQI